MAPSKPLDTQMLVMGLSRIAKSAKGMNVAYTELVVEDREMDDVELIQKYPNLHHVSLGGNKLSNLRPLAALTDLLTLDVSNNCLVQALDFGEGVTSNNLSRAILANNQICSLAALAPHVHLHTLIISDNQIHTLEPLRGLPQLRYVDASCNEIETVDGMCGQPLQELHLSNNRIKTLSGGIGTLTDLEVLTLNNNKLKSIEPLHQCVRLTAVEVENNLLEMEAVVDPLQGLCFLRHLRLNGNPVEQGMVMPGQAVSAKYKDLPLPDFRRLVYRWRLVYRLLRLETLDGSIVQPEEKVAAGNFCGADRDAHEHCYNKYFPTSQDPMRGHELTIARLHRPEPHVDGEMLFPDVWLHRVVQRTLELDYQAVTVKGAWDVDSTIDPAEETQAITVHEAMRVIICLGTVNTVNLGVQRCGTSVAVVTKEELPWRVRQIHSCFDHDHLGLCLLADLQAVDSRFFGEPAPRKGLRHDSEGCVTAGQLVEWFDLQREELGQKAVEEVVVHFEDAIRDMGLALPAPAVTTYLESGHAKVAATLEGHLEPGTYQVAARCSLSEQGALEKASGGEPYFLMVMGDKDFMLGGIQSRSMQQQQGTFSASFNRPLSRMQIAQSRSSASRAKSVEPLGPAPPKLSDQMCVGRYGSRVESEGEVHLRTMELFKDGTCQISFEAVPAGEAPSLEATWIDGAWGVQLVEGEDKEPDQRLVVEGIDGSISVVAVFAAIGDRPTRFPAGFELESLDGMEEGEPQHYMGECFFAPRWLSNHKYREEHEGQDPVDHRRDAFETIIEEPEEPEEPAAEDPME